MKRPQTQDRLIPGRLPRRPLPFRLAPGPEATAALAGRLGLTGLTGLSFAGTLQPAGRDDWRLEGRLEAVVTQPCVVTLDPVVTAIAEPVTRRYVAGLAAPAEAETEMPPDDSVEPLPREIDLAAVMAEALDLALPLYPRSPAAMAAAAAGAEAGDAAPAPGPDAAPGGDTRRPFAGLADLLSRPGRKDG